jgi:hypothetical protein
MLRWHRVSRLGLGLVLATRIASADSLTISPSRVVLPLGGAQRLELRDSSGASVSGAEWSLSAPDVVSLSTSPIVMVAAVAAGEVTIAATAGGESAEATVTVAQAGATVQLDLTVAKGSCAALANRPRRGPAIVHTIDGPAPLPPLQVRLLRTDRDAYRVGDPLSFDVALKNTGTSPIQLPWSLSAAVCDALSRPDQNVEELRVALLALASKGAPVLIASATLYGIRGQASSFAILAPGEEVTVRVPGSWRQYERTMPDVSEAFAKADMVGGLVEPSVKSANRIPVRTLPPR